MADNMLLYTAVYDNLDDALNDLDALDALHEDAMIGKFDAAVIDQENGKPHIAKRMDRPRIRVIPEVFGSGALPRKELKDAASELTSDQAGLIVVGEPTLEKGFDKAVTRAAKIVKWNSPDFPDTKALSMKEPRKDGVRHAEVSPTVSGGVPSRGGSARSIWPDDQGCGGVARGYRAVAADVGQARSGRAPRA